MAALQPAATGTLLGNLWLRVLFSQSRNRLKKKGSNKFKHLVSCFLFTELYIVSV